MISLPIKNNRYNQGDTQRETLALNANQMYFKRRKSE